MYVSVTIRADSKKFYGTPLYIVSSGLFFSDFGSGYFAHNIIDLAALQTPDMRVRFCIPVKSVFAAGFYFKYESVIRK